MKSRQPPDDGVPKCVLCRDGTYATQSLQMFPENEGSWYNYCDVCGPAMASVIRGSYQKRTPEIRRLPTPPPKPVKVPEPPPVPKPVKVPVALPAPAPLPAPKPLPVRTNLLQIAREVEREESDNDLLALLGWKK